MSAYDRASMLFDMAKRGEDGTISAYNHDLPGRGYWVGGNFPSFMVDDLSSLDRGELAWWIGSNKAPFYGVWADSKTGKIYFDGVTHMFTADLALRLAEMRGEIAIWDILAGVEIRVANAEGI